MSATVPYGPVKELEISSRTRRGKKVIPSIMVSPSIGSSDGKTYIKKLSQQKARTTTYPKKPKTGSLPPLPARPAQVVIDTVTAFYQENPLMESQGNHRRGVSASSHNAVIQNMTPAMRRSLKARRIRGGAVSSAILQRLEVGMYFGIWYALNAIYNSTFHNSSIGRCLGYAVTFRHIPLTIFSFSFRAPTQLSTRKC